MNEELEGRLADALTPNPDRTPPPERIAALRAHAEHRARSIEDPRPVSLAPRRGRRDLLVGGIAASIGAALGVGGARTAATDDDTPDTPPTEAIAFTGGPRGVRTTGALINHTWGTELMLDVEGLPPDNVYSVFYEGPAGDLGVAGSFLSVADVVMKCRFNAAVLRADATAVVVVGPDDGEVLRADLS